MKCVFCKRDIFVKNHATDEYNPKQYNYQWSDGNNAEPLAKGRCCDICDCLLVIPHRMGLVTDVTNATLFGIGMLHTRLEQYIRNDVKLTIPDEEE